jgi:hypothetical protein
MVQYAVQETRRNIRDMSGDGLINCQDYAILFERYYPGARIIYNPLIGPTGHLYNRITVGGEYVYIEPQAPEGKWLMEEAWANWDSVKLMSVDVTQSWRDLGWLK